MFLVNIPFTLYLIFNAFLSTPLPGWTTLMVMLSAFFGLSFLMLGMMSEYLHRIYLETTGRPLYSFAPPPPPPPPGPHVPADAHRILP